MNPSLRSRLWIIGLSVLVCAAAAVVLRHWRTPPAASLPEVTRAQLTQVDGRFYRPGAGSPYTGWMADSYENGRLKCRSAVSNGLLEGLTMGWHTNGQQQIQEWFQAGVSHGRRTKWYENGAKQSEADIVEGKIQGTFRRWHPEGALAEEISMKDGQPHGLSRAFYPNGQLKAQARMHLGQVVEQKFWPEKAAEAALSTPTNAPLAAQLSPEKP